MAWRSHNHLAKTSRKLLPFAKFLEWRSNNCSLADDTVSSDAHVGQVTSNDALRHNNRLIKDNKKQSISLIHQEAKKQAIYNKKQAT